MSFEHPRFEVRARLGAGAAGEVLRAWDRELNEEVAIKVLTRVTDAQVTRLRREVKIARRLMHPHIRPTYDLLDLAGGQRAVTMAYVQGQSLEQRLAEGPPPSVQTCLTWMLQLAQALEHAHEEGIVHRDVKPANVLIREDGEALLADFGVADAAALDMHATQSGVVMGTPMYMAPEQLAGEGVDGRADLYALGLVALQCLEGQQPIRARWDRAPRVRRAGLPEGIAELVDRLLEPDPSRRPAAAEVVRTLQSLLAARGWATEAQVRVPTVPRSWVAVLGSAVLALSAWALWDLMVEPDSRPIQPVRAPVQAPAQPGPHPDPDPAPSHLEPEDPAPERQAAPPPPKPEPKKPRPRFEPTPM